MAGTLPLVEVVASPIDGSERDPLIGLELHGYVIVRAISSGGMGVVYEAHHPLIGHRAAVKVLRPELGRDVELAARFLREARAVSAVKHRNIVEIFNFGTLPNGGQYMMMEYLEGEALSEVIERDAPMKPAQALAICDEILLGLVAAHQVGVVHRDLKPANIVLTRQSSEEVIVKVVDFGLARLLDTRPEANSPEPGEARVEKASILAGTPEYISPEQAEGKAVDAQGDLYALGVILFEMLTGRLPFEASCPVELIHLHRTAAPPRLGRLVPDAHPALESLVDRLLAKDPLGRPLSAKVARESIARIMELTRGSSQTVRMTRPLRWWRVSPGVVIVAIGIGVAGTLGLDALQQRPGLLEPPGVTEVKAIEAQVVSVSQPAPPVERSPRKVRPAPPARRKGACIADPIWRRGVEGQVEDLEKLTLARMPQDADPAQVAQVKSKARALLGSARNVEGPQCDLVEAQLRAWRDRLH